MREFQMLWAQHPGRSALSFRIPVSKASSAERVKWCHLRELWLGGRWSEYPNCVRAGLNRPQTLRNNETMKVVALALCLGLVGGCAGGTPEAEAPDDSDELYEDDPVEQTRSSGEPSEAAEGAEDAEEPAADA